MKLVTYCLSAQQCKQTCMYCESHSISILLDLLTDCAPCVFAGKHVGHEMNERRKHQAECGADKSVYVHSEQWRNIKSRPFHENTVFTLPPLRPQPYGDKGLYFRGSELLGLQGDNMLSVTVPSNWMIWHNTMLFHVIIALYTLHTIITCHNCPVMLASHCFCHSAGILLSPPAEAQHWEDNTRGDTTEQRGRRWESDIAKQSQGKAGEQSETSIKVQEWEQTREDPGRWSSHCEPSQRSSQGDSRWTNHTCSCVHIHASCASRWIIFTIQLGDLYFVISNFVGYGILANNQIRPCWLISNDSGLLYMQSLHVIVRSKCFAQRADNSL